MVEDGVILHREALFILPSEFANTCQHLHEGHQSYIKMLLHAKNVIYWPGLDKHVEHLIVAYSICQCFQSQHADPPTK